MKTARKAKTLISTCLFAAVTSGMLKKRFMAAPNAMDLWRGSRSVRLVPVLMLIQITGAVIGLFYVVHGLKFHHGNILNKLVAWDGDWYLDIAESGYHWNHTLAATADHNLAFFPLWGIVDRICILFFGSFFKAAIILVSWVSGLASIFFFEKLARKTVGQSAGMATILYSFWPASSFYLMGYPTGIINICAIAALDCYICRRVWLAAAWIGLGTFAGPTMVFAGAPIGIHFLIEQLRKKPVLIGLGNVAGWALLSLSGILAFILYQTVAFHDPLAFVEVQAAWGYSPPPIGKLYRLSSFSYDTYEFRDSLHNLSSGGKDIASGAMVEGSRVIQGGIQNLVNFVCLCICLSGLAAGCLLIRRHRLLLVLSGCMVVAGYVWFIMLTNANMLATPRLIFPAVAMFLGLGALADRARGLGAIFIPFFVLVSLLEVAFVVGGYWVV